VRLSRAKVMLAHSKLPLKAVASACGFADEYYFSSVFRRIEGLPPGGYRERAQAGTRSPSKARAEKKLESMRA
jgi:transcriptional regulator GlxA family with amidase domain